MAMVEAFDHSREWQPLGDVQAHLHVICVREPVLRQTKAGTRREVLNQKSVEQAGRVVGTKDQSLISCHFQDPVRVVDNHLVEEELEQEVAHNPMVQMPTSHTTSPPFHKPAYDFKQEQDQCNCQVECL
mmetsp:Transcript_45906/g.95690  ORF Transcript_45906/g.95690 Transcript_45906/m.95690 type:complete len:129 (+) Transcript_45906:105-491(+)